MGLVEFAVNNQWPLLFYGAVILLIVLLREKFEWQGFGMGICRTNTGLKLMTRLGTKYRGLVTVLGYIGIGVGFVGMGLILWSLAQGAFKFLTDLSAPPVVTPVIPGFAVPGFGLEVPLITGWIALFALLVIHEFSHGVVSVAHRIPVKSSGLLVFGPLFGAFVEPDEKKLEREHETVNYAISAAGPWSNILSAGIVVLLMFLIVPLTGLASDPDGVRITAAVDGYPAATAGLAEGDIIRAVDGVPVLDRAMLTAEMTDVAPGEAVTLTTNSGAYTVTTVENPTNATSTTGYLGVNIEDHFGAIHDGIFWTALASTALWIRTFFSWFIILSLGIGLANLLPIGPLDGGRMVRLAAEQITGNRKRGDVWWKRISVVTLVVLVLLLVFPLVRWLVA